MDLTTTELSLVVLAGLTSGIYAKSEGASSVLAGVIGVGVAVIICLLTQ